MAQYGFLRRKVPRFWSCRALLGDWLQGGFIPDVSSLSSQKCGFLVPSQIILYLSYIYKHHELSVHLSFFLDGHEHRRYPCRLSSGLITLVVGLASLHPNAARSMPDGPVVAREFQAGSASRYVPYLSILRPQTHTLYAEEYRHGQPRPSRRPQQRHHAQPGVRLPWLLWKSLCDYDLWPLYILGLTLPRRP
ncbi:hypothetical protein N7492_010708 [Penicillium capsulatum]|uniref:Uncharacterized protein n=1 Tax=Penicillium capsulatum TaxID=69766 RepID=A0A9W9HP72_9EURO|nr:hypothetical protein N7492_010708 [Penicillium capsulatum]